MSSPKYIYNLFETSDESNDNYLGPFSTREKACAQVKVLVPKAPNLVFVEEKTDQWTAQADRRTFYVRKDMIDEVW